MQASSALSTAQEELRRANLGSLLGKRRVADVSRLTDFASQAREKWSQLLRQYCRLDTLSMVLIFNHWKRATQTA
jgi:hypothetical protein